MDRWTDRLTEPCFVMCTVYTYDEHDDLYRGTKLFHMPIRLSIEGSHHLKGWLIVGEWFEEYRVAGVHEQPKATIWSAFAAFSGMCS